MCEVPSVIKARSMRGFAGRHGIVWLCPREWEGKGGREEEEGGGGGRGDDDDDDFSLFFFSFFSRSKTFTQIIRNTHSTPAEH